MYYIYYIYCIYNIYLCLLINLNGYTSRKNIINIESNYGTLDSRRGNGIMETDLNQIGGKESRISERPDDETEINEAQRYNPYCIAYTAYTV